jgi:ketosteroid isomerase-like protein
MRPRTRASIRGIYSPNMNRWTIRIALLALAAFQFGCSDAPKASPDTRAADEKTIRELETEWAKDIAAKDLDKDVAHYDNDASFLLQNMPIVNGKTSITGVHKGLMGDSNFALDFSAAKVEVSKSSDLAYSQGAYSLTTTNPKTKKPETEKGKYITVYKKQADGGWKAIEDMLNSDAPAVPVKTAKAEKPAAKAGKKAKKAHK